ncbi:MAG: DUF6470 family protein [Peptococcaceae bacterium]|nr:DUF6470 family protein [Peptococcaceae bacterium]
MEVSLNTSPGQFDLKRIPPDIILERIPPEVDLTISPGQVSIDMTMMQNSLGYGNAEFITRSLVAEAKQIFDSDLVRTVQVGDEMAKMPMAVSIGQVAAKAKFFDKPHPEISMEYIAPPEIHYEPGDIRYEVRLGRIRMNADMGKVEMITIDQTSRR